MPLDDDGFDYPGDDDYGEPALPWLPPEDRLWRHPSELAGPPGGGGGGRRISGRRWPAAARPWPIALSAGVVGAVLATGVVAASGHLGIATRPSQQATSARTTASTVGAVTPVAGTSGSALRARSGGLGASASVAQMAERVAPAMVTLEIMTLEGSRRGSGLVVRDDGMILTTDHLVDGATSITAVLSSGAEETAAVVGDDPSSDVAVLHVDANSLPTAQFGPPDSLHKGQLTEAVTLSDSANNHGATVYLGTVEQVRSQFALSGSEPPLLDAIETDAPVGGYVEGGALLDGQGRVVGVTSGTLTNGSTVHCLATPAALDQQSANQLMATGHAEHAWLGIEGVTSGLPGSPQTSPHGVEVVSVAEGSPALAAGLKPGEVITSVDLEPIASMLDLQGAVRLLDPGSQVGLGVYHSGANQLVQATLGSTES